MDESVAAGAPPVRLGAVPGSGGHLFSLLVVCFGVNGPRPVVVRSPGDIRQSTDAFRRRVRCGSRRAARSGSGRGVGRCASGPARVRQRGCLCTRWRLPASIHLRWTANGIAIGPTGRASRRRARHLTSRTPMPWQVRSGHLWRRKRGPRTGAVSQHRPRPAHRAAGRWSDDPRPRRP